MDSLLALSNDLAGAVERAGRAVVAVHARRRLPSSGVHWRPGLVVTAEHTVQAEAGITITRPDGRNVPATLVGRDPGTDLALLSVEDGGFPTAEMGDTATLKVGHMVLALGHGPTASLGVVSALGGPWTSLRGGQVDLLVRLDLTLYPGFSGGPLVGVEGRVLGINTSGLSRLLRLSIPAATVARVGEELARTGRVARGYLGLGMQPVRLPEALRHSLGLPGDHGLIVVNVEPDGPAAAAGLLIGDVLVALDGTALSSVGDVQAALARLRAGAAAAVSIVRAGARMEVRLTVGERPRRGR